MKLDRSAFVYLQPRGSLKVQNTFGNCRDCKMHIADRRMCSLLGPDLSIDAEDSCCEYTPGGPAEESEVEHVGANFTPEEVGFVRDTPVRCENCVSFTGDSKCALFTKLNFVLPALFNLDPTVHPLGCCNAFRPRSS